MHTQFDCCNPSKPAGSLQGPLDYQQGFQDLLSLKPFIISLVVVYLIDIDSVPGHAKSILHFLLDSKSKA